MRVLFPARSIRNTPDSLVPPHPASAGMNTMARPSSLQPSAVEFGGGSSRVYLPVTEAGLASSTATSNANGISQGLAIGALVQHGDDAPVRQRPAVADAIQSVGDNAIVGDPGIVASVGSLAWITAVLAATIAYRQVGAPLVATILLGLSFMVVSHPPPIGPIGLVCFAGAVALLARAQRASSRLEAGGPAPIPT